MEVLFENENLIVFDKPCGIDCEKNLPQGCFLVHRLDKTTSGVWVCAKTKEEAAYLSDLISNRKFEKSYIAILQGKIEQTEGVLQDYLYHDRIKNKSYVVKKERKGTKLAILEYNLEKITDDNNSLVKIKLKTGRTHQIRVQFASRGYPLLGDKKYGSKIDRSEIALLCYQIKFDDYVFTTKKTLH